MRTPPSSSLVCSADIDECLTHKCLPHQRCVNTEGSFTCRAQITCPPGYHLKSSGCQGEFPRFHCALSAVSRKQCQCNNYYCVCPDIDECAMRKDRCGKDFLCENTPGSFKCTPKQKCLSGFTQDAHGNCVGKTVSVCWKGSCRSLLSLDCL